MKKRKASQFDFKESSLPSNRKELFVDVFKNNWRVLLNIGMVLFFFAVPFIIVYIIKDYTTVSFYAMLSNGELTEEEYYSIVVFNNIVYDAINILSFGIFGIGVAGVIKIIKRLCFLDPVFFGDDFKAGVKDNGKHMFFVFAIFGFVTLINNFSLIQESNNIIAVIPSCVAYSIVYPTLLIMIMMIAIYNIKFGQCFFNSFLLYVKTVLKTMLAYVIFIVPFIAISFIDSLFPRYGILALVILLVLPILLVAIFDYCCSIFDKYINQTQYPEIYRKGLVDSNKQR